MREGRLHGAASPFGRAIRWCVALAAGALSAGLGHAATLPESNVIPSIEFTGFTQFFSHNLCSSGGSADLAEIDSGFNSGQSDCAYLIPSGTSGSQSQFCENGPFGAGNFTHFFVSADQNAYSVAPGTPVSVVDYSYNGPNGTGPITFVSRIAFACDTGHVLGIASFVPITNNCNEADPQTLCLGNGRFRVVAYYFLNGIPNSAQAVQLTPDTGYFYFFTPTNVEAIIKVVNGCGLNQNFWVFAGGLTNLQTRFVVTDVVTGLMKIYNNPANTAFKPLQDTGAFNTCNAVPTRETETAVDEAGSAPTLFLHGRRFAVNVTWTTTDGKSGSGTPYQLTDDTGYFWFFKNSNVEMVIKVLNGCGLNNAYWVFAGGLTNVKALITVTDTKTGKSVNYHNPQGQAFQPIQDTGAFKTCP